MRLKGVVLRATLLACAGVCLPLGLTSTGSQRPLSGLPGGPCAPAGWCDAGAEPSVETVLSELSLDRDFRHPSAWTIDGGSARFGPSSIKLTPARGRDVQLVSARPRKPLAEVQASFAFEHWPAMANASGDAQARLGLQFGPGRWLAVGRVTGPAGDVVAVVVKGASAGVPSTLASAAVPVGSRTGRLDLRLELAGPRVAAFYRIGDDAPFQKLGDVGLGGDDLPRPFLSAGGGGYEGAAVSVTSFSAVAVPVAVERELSRADRQIVDAFSAAPSHPARFATADDTGASMDGLQVVDSGTGAAARYLAVYHSCVAGCAADLHGNVVMRARLAVSADLKTWRFHGFLDDDIEFRMATPFAAGYQYTAQPALHRDRHGGYWLAHEVFDRALTARIRVVYFPSLDRLLAFTPERTTMLPPTLSKWEGTPNFHAVDYQPGDAGRARVVLGFHALDAGRQRDSLSFGLLDGWTRWSAWSDPREPAIRATLGIAGNIGDRHTLALDASHRYMVLEVQAAIGDWSSWRLALVRSSPFSVTMLPVSTPGASRAFSNPSITLLRLPDGSSALLASAFLPGEGAAAGEAGAAVTISPYRASAVD